MFLFILVFGFPCFEGGEGGLLCRGITVSVMAGGVDRLTPHYEQHRLGGLYVCHYIRDHGPEHGLQILPNFDTMGLATVRLDRLQREGSKGIRF